MTKSPLIIGLRLHIVRAPVSALKVVGEEDLVLWHSLEVLSEPCGSCREHYSSYDRIIVSL